MNPVRLTSSLTGGAKPKKQLKNKFRGQQGQASTNTVNSNSNQNDSNLNEKDKGSPVKEFQDYAGVSSESIRLYTEFTSEEELSEQACNILTEDINYKLRHIIHDCLVKSKVQGRDVITCDDVDETFSNLNIGKVYGAPSSPNWVPFRDRQDTTLYHLEDQKVNLVELAEQEFNASQEGDTVIDQVWLPDGNDSEDDMDAYNETFAEYFQTMCEAVISDSEEIRRMALVDISTNPSIGPITDWFYHFSYFLLTKDVTYDDRLTMRALQLLEVLENSPLPSLHIYAKQLKLLVRLLMQRLLMSVASDSIIKQMCYVLSLLCLRAPLKKLVLTKLEDKIACVCEEMAVPLLNIVYYIGVDAVEKIFIPNLPYFLARVVEENDPNMTEIILAIFGQICKANLNKDWIYECFKEAFGEILVPFYRPKQIKTGHDKKDIDIVKMKRKLIKTRRKVDYRSRPIRHAVQKLDDETFDITPHTCTAVRQQLIEQAMGISKQEVHGGVSFRIASPCCALRHKLVNHQQLYEASSKSRRETQITVGKTSLLLSVLKREKSVNCSDHSLYAYVL